MSQSSIHFQFRPQIGHADLNQVSIVWLEGPLFHEGVNGFAGTDEGGGFFSHRGSHR